MTAGTRAQPAATLSLDLDNLWCYQRSFGLAGWQDYPSFAERALPRILAILDRLDLRLTLFIIGRDAERPSIRGLLGEAVGAGHEAANHSYDHDPEMLRWAPERIGDDIARAENAIVAATGQRPHGFRGPAFAVSPRMLEVLVGRGYAYDASSFPNSLGALARSYHRRQMSRLASGAPRTEPAYGGLAEAWQPLRPFRWSLPKGALVEVPVTTMPILRLPFHGTYLHHLADRSPGLARAYFRASLGLCRLRGVPPSLLLHLTDVIGHDDCPGLDYLPGMRRSGAQKAAFLEGLLAAYRDTFRVMPTGGFIDALQARQPLHHVSLAAVS
ncbi:polysaccharide deacetylase family protein [Pelagibius sp. 7325]|uniref:polysaccharide deacetylase family protein n=1 Tax=Pelagibius sp. 7325 TaxID=3131994 RepID=UPI0030ED6F3D